MVIPHLRTVVQRLPAALRGVAEYHFGWVDEHGRAFDLAGSRDSGGGKMVRPVLALLSAEVVGGYACDALPAAAAVELTHNFSLIHDDVMDGDRTRRHRATVWSVFGIPAAVLAGDALWTLALQVLCESSPASGEAMGMLCAAMQAIVRGQSADTNFECRDEVGLPECVAMAADKTGALIGCACALGALYGGGNPAQIDRLRRFGEHLGLAFQLVDDLLGIWGDPTTTGKPAGSDLANRKKSLPVVAALHSRTSAGDELASLYRLDRPLTAAELVRAAILVEASGGRRWARSQADRHAASALRLLNNTATHPPTATALTAVAHLITHRNH
ncbi:polyprenyl synthetase family protein [Nocardia terpenica]|uniref:Polyprenyl synthetase family protein n=2 Tax=Nocardia terpenica TaxID=455432 RepID=A0A6G9ZHD8_9NOCA|nr:polyprenyl synthetase family protein [Nocardia terpenica]